MKLTPKFTIGQRVVTCFASASQTHHTITNVVSHENGYRGQSYYGYAVYPALGSGGWIDEAWFFADGKQLKLNMGAFES